MQQTLTPKQVARAIGVSESSLKRWCDRGVIHTERTAGGHRRIRVSDVLRFLRENEREILRPEILGLPPGTGVRPRVIRRAETRLIDALLEGDAEIVRRLVFDLYINGAEIVALCDDVIAPALHEVGEQWDCGAAEVYQERRACEIVGHILYELGTVLPATDVSAPRAVGGTPSGDDYRVPTQMVELALRDAGWNATSLGSSLPVETMQAAVDQHRPELFWISVSHIKDDELAAALINFRQQLPPTTRFVLGGRALSQDLVESLRPTAYCNNMRELRSSVELSLAG